MGSPVHSHLRFSLCCFEGVARGKNRFERRVGVCGRTVIDDGVTSRVVVVTLRDIGQSDTIKEFIVHPTVCSRKEMTRQKILEKSSWPLSYQLRAAKLLAVGILISGREVPVTNRDASCNDIDHPISQIQSESYIRSENVSDR